MGKKMTENILAAPIQKSKLFNSPLECGLRSLILLTHAHPLSCDLQRLVFLDYLLIHSGDADGPDSIHPPTPSRSGEFIVRRELTEKGLMLMLSRKLIEREPRAAGFYYKANNNSVVFLDTLETPYIQSLREVADWVIEEFGSMTDKKLETFFRQNMDRWGSELHHVENGKLL